MAKITRDKSSFILDMKSRKKHLKKGRKWADSSGFISFASFQKDCRELGISLRGYLSFCLLLWDILREDEERGYMEYSLSDIMETHEIIRLEKGISKGSVSRSMNMDKPNCTRFFRKPWQKSTNMQRILDMSSSVGMEPDDFFRRIDEHIMEKREKEDSSL